VIDLARDTDSQMNLPTSLAGAAGAVKMTASDDIKRSFIVQE